MHQLSVPVTFKYLFISHYYFSFLTVKGHPIASKNIFKQRTSEATKKGTSQVSADQNKFHQQPGAISANCKHTKACAVPPALQFGISDLYHTQCDCIFHNFISKLQTKTENKNIKILKFDISFSFTIFDPQPCIIAYCDMNILPFFFCSRGGKGCKSKEQEVRYQPLCKPRKKCSIPNFMNILLKIIEIFGWQSM